MGLVEYRHCDDYNIGLLILEPHLTLSLRSVSFNIADQLP